MQPDRPFATLRATRRSDSPRARSAGPDTPAMVVHSVFASAMNIDGPDGLLTIARDRIGGLPNGILVAGEPDFRALGLRPGMPVEWGDLRVVISAAAVSVDLRSAIRWSPRIPAADPGAAAVVWRHRSSIARDLARRASVGGGLDATPSAQPYLTALAAAISVVDRPAAVAAARALIGRGPGLTPSGDDALAGVEAALRAVGHPLAGFLGDALDDVDVRTTAVSAALLRHAARGDFAERIHRLVAALAGAPVEIDTAATDLPKEIADGIAHAAAWGATSGSDCLAGVLLGLDAATDRVAERRWAA